MIIFFKNYWLVSRHFWESKRGVIALAVLGVCVALEFASVAISVYLNKWNVAFYNSIQEYDKSLLIHQLIIFVVIVFLILSCSLISYVIGQYFKMFMRQPMTDYYVKHWLNTKVYLDDTTSNDNPEERICYDIENFISLSKYFFLGIISNVTRLISFSIILIGLSGVFSITVFGFHINIVGYMFWTAIVLGVLNMVAVFYIGKPLKKLIYQQQKYEADFRYRLSVIRSNKISIFDSQSEKRECIDSKRAFSYVVRNYYSVTFRQAKIDFITSIFSQFTSVLGTIMSLPRYFAKELSFGQMMQVNSAFMQVMFPMLFLVNSYSILAELSAAVSRLAELKKSIDRKKLSNSNYIIDNDQDVLLQLQNLSLVIEGKTILRNVNVSLHEHKSLLIFGGVGRGKTTLLRVINGHSDAFEGEVIFKHCPKVLFLPQKPYFPEDDFKRAVFYPSLYGIPSDDEFEQILDSLCLEKLKRFINTRCDWRNVLSSGEQQKLLFCKVFVKDYDLLLIDEATSNLDVPSEEKIYSFLKSKNVAFISVSHNEKLRQYHDSVIYLN